MKKTFVLILLIITTLFVGCATAEKPVDRTQDYQFLVANIDDSAAIQMFLEKGRAKGNDINDELMGGDTVLMIAARYTTNIEVLKTIVSYFPDINQMNYSNDMTALDYLDRRENVDDLYEYLFEESVKYEMNKKVDSVKNSVVKNIFNKF